MSVKFNRRYISQNAESLTRFIDKELTMPQKRYIIKYYCMGKKVREIAAEYGVNPSTVSRTIKRARLKIEKAAENAKLLS